MDNFAEAGFHGQVEIVDGKDINGRFMVKCPKCGTFAHSYVLEQAIADLRKSSCNPNCANCKRLRRSFDGNPAVPLNGSCNDRLHICPNDGNRWWQANGYFHLWQQVTDDREWKILRRR